MAKVPNPLSFIHGNGTILESKSTSLVHNLESVVPLVDDNFLEKDNANYVSYADYHINHELLEIFHCLYPEMDLTFLRNNIIRLKNDGVKIQEFLEAVSTLLLLCQEATFMRLTGRCCSFKAKMKKMIFGHVLSVGDGKLFPKKHVKL